MNTISIPNGTDQYKATMDAIAAAHEVCQQVADEWEEAQGASAEQVLAKIERGRLDLTVADVMANAYGKAVADARMKGAAALLDQAKKNRKGVFPPIVAAGLAHVVADALDASVNVVDAFERPEQGDLSVALRQVTLTEDADPKGVGVGRVAARVDVEFYRTRKHIAADFDGLEKALGEAGIIAVVYGHGSDKDGDLVVDRARIEVRAIPAYGKLMLGQSLSNHQIGAIGRALLGQAQGAVDRAGIFVQPLTGEAPDIAKKGSAITASGTFHMAANRAQEVLAGMARSGLFTICCEVERLEGGVTVKSNASGDYVMTDRVRLTVKGEAK